MPEPFRDLDLRLALSHLAQTNYATPLTPANLLAGKSYRPREAAWPEVTRILGREGPQPFTGHEFPIKENELELTRDTRVGLSFTADSFLAAWGPVFVLNKATSVQEGVTGHYTHTIIPSDPIAASGTRGTKVTSMYFEAVGPDAGRRKGIYQSLAVMQATLTMRRREPIILAVDLAGSGQEDVATAVTLPALTSEFILLGTNLKVEVGNQGAGLADLTARFREATLTFTQELLLDQGYIPNAATPASGKFRSDLRFLRRTASLAMAFEVDRSSTDLKDRVLNSTRTEVKITQDSGVVAGTGSKNHGFVFRVPDCRLREAPLNYDGGEALYAVSIPPEQMYPDAGIGAVPFQLVVENTHPTYFV